LVIRTFLKGLSDYGRGILCGLYQTKIFWK